MGWRVIGDGKNSGADGNQMYVEGITIWPYHSGVHNKTINLSVQ
ncbi:hypothetical protein JOD21_000553 [Jeotgalibacillus terrae]|nr:hypothetical protein [Jeotgalibacillus terrae]